MGFRRKSLASRAGDRAGETEAEVGIEEAGEREAIWVKDRCKSRADDERRNELADDEVENLDEDRARETIDFRAGNGTNSQETAEADEVELDHSGQTSFMTC